MAEGKSLGPVAPPGTKESNVKADAEYQRAYRLRRLAEDPAWDRKKAKRAYYGSGRDRLSALRLRAIEKYGGRCSCCGASEPAFLTFHHTMGNGKHERSRDLYARLVREEVREDIQLMCWNCHMATHRFGACPHKKS